MRRRVGPPSADRQPALGQPVLRVGGLAVHAPDVDLEVQVRAGGLALAADLGDLIAGRDDVAGGHVVVLHVAVDLDVAVGVPDVDGVAVAGGRPGPEHDAVGCGVDRGAQRRGQVDAPVHGAPALAEAGAEPAGGRHDEVGLAGGAGGGALAQPGLRLGVAVLPAGSGDVDAAGEAGVGHAQAVILPR